MLTKQERAEIATRFISYDGGTLYFAELFECLFNREIPGSTTTKEDTEAVIDRLFDLCDTSNMIELPIDKDGEVIRAGDTVYDNDIKYEVNGYLILDDGVYVVLKCGKSTCCLNRLANEVTHKQPVTIKSLAQRIKHVLEDEATSIGVNPYVELGRIAEQLESLGDSDDD